MSRGIGKLQREILEALNEAHEADFISYDYRTVYDLSAVKETLATRGRGLLCQMYVPELGEWYVWRSGAFEASFSRAIRVVSANGVHGFERFKALGRMALARLLPFFRKYPQMQ